MQKQLAINVNIYYLSLYYSKALALCLKKGGNNDQRANNNSTRDGKS
jgi:hypothetical protein